MQHFNLGNAAMVNEDFELAIKEFSLSIDLQNNNAVAYSNRAAAYLKQGQFQLALDDCNHALALDERLELGYYRKGY
jgi:Flp pilus assembly protein TadD